MLTIDEMIAFTGSGSERIAEIGREKRISAIEACALESASAAAQGRGSQGRPGPDAKGDDGPGPG